MDMPAKMSKAYFKAWHKAHPEALPAAMRKLNLSNLGLTAIEYDEMHATQKGVCLICAQPETALDTLGRVKRLSVDHDHDHPKANARDKWHRKASVRGLLCSRCNRGIGLLFHDPDFLDRAAAYLRAFLAKAA